MKRASAVILVLAACGGGGEGPPDASAYVPPVTIKVIGRTPITNAHVYFQSADSTLVADVLTDANGQASALVEPGGFVTVINPVVGLGPHAVTFASVQPGDEINLNAPDGNYVNKTVTVKAPKSGTADHYFVYALCGVTAPNTTVLASSVSLQVFTSDCPATTDILVAAVDASENLIEWIYAPSVAVSDGGTVDLTSASYAAPMTHAVTISGMPTGDTAQVQDIVGTSDSLIYAAFADITGNGVVNKQVPALGNPTSVIRIAETPMGSTQFKRYVQRRAPYAASTTIDLATSFVPDLTACPTLDHATQKLTWTAEAGGVSTNLQFLDIYSTGKSSSWSIIGPATPTLQLPTLPTDVHDFNITSDSTAVIEKLTIASTPDGYDAIRHQAAWTYPMGASVLDQYGPGAALEVLGPLTSGCP